MCYRPVVPVATRPLLPRSLEESDAYLLSRARGAMHRRAVEASAEQGLRMYAGTVLLAIGDLGPVSQRDLASAIGMDPADLVSQLDTLQHEGFVAREADPQDRRRNLIALTPLGWAKRDGWRAALREVEESVLGVLRPSQREALHEALAALARLDRSNEGG
jgi:DNA-binding MarR family transcriptional regulator